VWFLGGLVVVGGVEGEVAEEFTGGCVDDADVEVGDEHDDGGSGVGSPDAYVVELAVVAEGEFSELVDFVGADSMVEVGFGVGGACFGSGLVDGGGGCSVG